MMKCDRCAAEIGRTEKILALYPRWSDGRKWVYICCHACAEAFEAFIKEKKKEEGTGG